jgi:Tfp pilus assembly protein FimT
MSDKHQYRKRRVRRRRPEWAAGRASFTLLELLVSLGIILILAVLTMRLLNATLNSDRIRNGARELQTFLSGARDRAIHAGQPRGVRFITDPNDRSTVRSFVYIGATNTFTDGSLLSIDPNGNIYFVTNTPPAAPSASTTPTAVWTNLWNRGLLTDGTPIRLTVGSTPINLYLTVSATGTSATGPTGFAVTTVPPTTFPINFPFVATATSASYALQLAPTALSGDQPRALPTNIVIDLDNSMLPSGWTSPGGYSDKLDVLFAPNGTVMGPAASAGRIHFVLSEFADASVPVPLPGNSTVTGVPLMDATNTWSLGSTSGTYGPWAATTNYTLESWVVPNPLNDLAFRCVVAGQTGGGQPAQFATATPGSQFTDGTVTWECYNPKTRVIVSLATLTGRVTTSPVDPADRFRFAEVGEVTQ